MLPCCASYFTVANYVHVHSRWEYGLVSHALAACMRQLLNEYLVLIAQLEHQLASRRLTLLRAWYYLQPSMHTLQRLDKVCSRVARSTGGALLNVLHSLMLGAGDSESRALFTHLLSHASAPYFHLLTLWLTTGVLSDDYDEFGIRERTELDKDNVRRDFNDTYWDERYTIRQQNVPTFLQHCKNTKTHGARAHNTTLPQLELSAFRLSHSCLRCLISSVQCSVVF